LRIVNAMLGRGRGGLEQALLDYSDALNLLGHDVHEVIHPDAAVRPALERRNANWHGLLHLGAWDVFAAVRLRLLLRDLRPDICIAHGNRAMSLLRRAKAAPLIAVLPNYKMQCREADAVFYPTMDLKRHVESQGLDSDHLFHIPSMVRVPLSERQRLWRQPPVIGAMGRLVAKKGFEIFLSALAVLRSQGVPFRAILAGDGPERTALARLAIGHGLRDTLTFAGWVDDKQSFFDGIDVFCMPSHHEPFGIALIEAMAHAMPIVATDSEGPSEILRDGADGVLTPCGDPYRLAQALGEIIGDPERAQRIAASAYRRAQEMFDLPRVAARLDLAVRDVVRRAAAETTQPLEVSG
jgi:glycosyltransferase involved in cell wall biosynthesis